MRGDERGEGSAPASYLVTNLQRYAVRGYFEQYGPSHLHHLGFLLDMYHGGVLEPSTGRLRPDVTTLVHLDHRDTKRGYRAGRECYSVSADPHERRMTEGYLIERLCVGTVPSGMGVLDLDEAW